MSLTPPLKLTNNTQFTGGTWSTTNMAGTTDADFAPVILNCLGNYPNCSGIMLYYGSNGAMTWMNATGTMSSGNEYIITMPNVPTLCNTANIDTMYNPIFSQYCLSYCTQTENEGMCDNFMIPYCATAAGQADKKCACINSKVNSTGYNPLCVDQICQIYGYRTGGLQSTASQPCEIVDCTTAIQLKAGGNISLNNTNIAQNCGSNQAINTSATNTSVITPVAGRTVTQTQPVQPTTIFTPTNIIIGIVLILVIGGVILLNI
jgi:hypothetical protein